MNARIVHRVGDIEYGITEAIGLPDVGGTIKIASSAIRTGTKFIKSVSGNKGSVAKMARDYVMQFPVIASSSIPEEDLFPITKNFEIQYAQFIAMILQGISGINVKDISSTSDILKQIHSNDDVPNLLDYAMDLTGGRNPVEPKKANESVTIGIPMSELNALSYGTDAEFTLENLNSMYRPNENMLNKYERITSAMEASGSKPTPNPDSGSDTGNNPSPNPDSPEKKEYEQKRNLLTDKQIKKTEKDITRNNISIKQQRIDLKKSSINSVSASDLNKIQNTGEAPTVLTATLYLESENGTPEPRTLIFGVKTMVRSIPSNIMVPNVTECIASNTWAFRFVKWTKGETKFFRDIVFDISNAKKEALSENDPAGAWFNSIKRRKRNSRWFKSKTNISPIMTLIITDAEAEAIKAQTGIDLTQDAAASKLMKDMFLLGFGIYNTANGNVDIMLDKYSNGQFYSTTMTGLRAANRNGSNTDLREINKLLQNGGYIR